MNLTLLYHRVGEGKHATPLARLEQHFSFLAKNFSLLLPGEAFTHEQSVTLSFDDASFDFYHFVYPLLKKYQLRALLAVPVKFILEQSDINPKERLKPPYYEAMQEGVYQKYAPFCTWNELREMLESGLVEVASHSFSHQRMDQNTEFSLEFFKSKLLLEKKLKQEVSSFVYPFGRYNRLSQLELKKYYPYAFRIGNGANTSWKQDILYRVSADGRESLEPLFSYFFKKKLLWKTSLKTTFS